jgi:hypothetical protein
MARFHPKALPLTLQIGYLTVRVDAEAPLACLKCKGSLDIQQPNPEQPDQLFGVCVECGSWHVLERKESASTQVLIRVPIDSLMASVRSMLEEPRPGPKIPRCGT